MIKKTSLYVIIRCTKLKTNWTCFQRMKQHGSFIRDVASPCFSMNKERYKTRQTYVNNKFFITSSKCSMKCRCETSSDSSAPTTYLTHLPLFLQMSSVWKWIGGTQNGALQAGPSLLKTGLHHRQWLHVATHMRANQHHMHLRWP